MRVDVVSWTKNGAKYLPAVLKRLEEALPSEDVHRKILVDDHSVDNTREIAKDFGWEIYLNPSTGISAGANYALSKVDCKYFISIEQDLLLAKDWWLKIPQYLSNPKTAAASGMRFASQPAGVTKLQRYVAKKYRGESTLSPWLRSREMGAFTLGKTLDNTIYRTSVIRAVGGFPKMQVNAGVDTILAYMLHDAGYDWRVDYTVQSIHLRAGLKHELQHQYLYGTQLKEIWRKIRENSTAEPPINRFGVLSRLFMSPFTGIFVALKTREPTITYIHPLIKLYYIKGLLNTQ
ncbi:MAG: glycosyltransferase [Candidatus Bathyarchaeota archaeon]|nr:glycosyltransferase [Candidatus Bathyarchaeota archaeon]